MCEVRESRGSANSRELQDLTPHSQPHSGGRLIPWLSSSSLSTCSSCSTCSGRLWKFRGFLESERMLGAHKPLRSAKQQTLSPFP